MEGNGIWFQLVNYRSKNTNMKQNYNIIDHLHQHCIFKFPSVKQLNTPQNFFLRNLLPFWIHTTFVSWTFYIESKSLQLYFLKKPQTITESKWKKQWECQFFSESEYILRISTVCDFLPTKLFWCIQNLYLQNFEYII